ncbi:hypothetical protein B0J13DRAFT_627345 [Dactylonectria estremocensis]|uniref:Nucleoside phosphorylase domain-containing protein n=1 Tax=Dactylonectria estremocensis TaxID=1079267 RepID=A0A9P9E007_9HYPO|nr:hypothetical protein B0J13DRAFT_627345 [Dactylonectria estremocensis]
MPTQVGRWPASLRNRCIKAFLLDHEHERLDPAADDPNNYILGDVEGHNISIAYQGLGIMGETAATHVATNMLRTFEKIRFGLLVGVAGGAPGAPDPEDPRKDIRLGEAFSQHLQSCRRRLGWRFWQPRDTTLLNSHKTLSKPW